MQFLDDDIDQLARRAAADYPLRTDSSDWEKLQEALRTEQVLSHVEAEKKPGKQARRLLWLLLLIPVVFVCNRYELDDSPLGKKTTAPEMLSPLSKTKSKADNKTHEKTAVATMPIGPKQQSVSVDKIATKGSLQNPDSKVQKGDPPTKQSISVVIDHQGLENKRVIQHPKRANVDYRKNIGTNIPPEKSLTTVDPTSKENFVNIHGDNLSANQSQTEKETTISQINDTATTGIEEDPMRKTTSISEDLNKDSINTVNESRKPAKPMKEKKFFLGIVAGLDATNVNGQSIKDAGYHIGIVAGYQLSKRFSIETGLLHSKKFYYTKGEYYNQKDYLLPPYTTLEDVDGYCQMFEVPISIRYIFKKGKKTDWFISGGLTSYLMKAERYQMNYESTSQWYPYNYSYQYSNPTPPQYWFGVLQFSAGFTRSIGKFGDLRVEPYFKTPLGRVGSGDLKISSFGLQLAVTRKLF